DEALEREIRVGVVGQLPVEARVDGVRAGDEKERVAVRGCARNRFGADDGAAAGPVLDDYRLSPGFGEFSGDDPSEQIGPAARRHRHDDADGLARVLLRARRMHSTRDRQSRRNQANGCRVDVSHALYSSCHAETKVSSRFPSACTRMIWRGRTTVVVPICASRAGPPTRPPGGGRARSKSGQATTPPLSRKWTRREPVRALPGAEAGAASAAAVWPV